MPRVWEPRCVWLRERERARAKVSHFSPCVLNRADPLIFPRLEWHHCASQPGERKRGCWGGDALPDKSRD